MQPEFDVIVVGAGPAGAATALTLARKGADVLMLEKAKIPGERNMTGGVIYGTFEGGRGLLDLVPDFETTAPVQRKIVSHEVSVLSDPDWDEGTYHYYRLTHSSIASRLGLFKIGLESGHDYSVLRRDFDQWFANRAVAEGAMLSTQTSVEELIKEDGAVVGVRTTHEDLRAKLVVDASGVTSNLVEMAGLRGKLVPSQLYHGLKHVFKLDPAEIEKRFRLGKGEGKAQLYLGNFMKGVNGGAFIYTNRDTLSVGVVVSMDSMIRVFTEEFDRAGKALDVLNAFENHPMIAGLLQGAEVVEYSAHNVPKGYKCMLGNPAADGFLVSGDALGAFVKIGPLLDGMRRAVATGIMAAEAYLKADSLGSFKASALASYKDMLSPIYRDIGKSKSDSRISESNLVYQRLPGLIFWLPGFSRVGRIRPGIKKDASRGDAIKRVQLGTSLLNYDEDAAYSHIKVDAIEASKTKTKPWVPSCPVNCYTLVTQKGVYASYYDLFEHNAETLRPKIPNPNKIAVDAITAVAMKTTLQDVATGELRFDHVACVACGTCGEIGPRELVTFTPERDGHGVRYRYG